MKFITWVHLVEIKQQFFSVWYWCAGVTLDYLTKVVFTYVGAHRGAASERTKIHCIIFQLVRSVFTYIYFLLYSKCRTVHHVTTVSAVIGLWQLLPSHDHPHVSTTTSLTERAQLSRCGDKRCTSLRSFFALTRNCVAVLLKPFSRSRLLKARNVTICVWRTAMHL